MKKAIKRVAQKSNRKLQEMLGQMEVNLMLPIAELMRETQWHVEQLAGAAGLKIIQHIIADDAWAVGRGASLCEGWQGRTVMGTGKRMGWVCGAEGERGEAADSESTERPRDEASNYGLDENAVAAIEVVYDALRSRTPVLQR